MQNANVKFHKVGYSGEAENVYISVRQIYSGQYVLNLCANGLEHSSEFQYFSGRGNAIPTLFLEGERRSHTFLCSVVETLAVPVALCQ